MNRKTLLLVAPVVLLLGGNVRPSGPRFERVYPLKPEEGVFAYSRISPDGRFLAYLDQAQNVDLAPYVGHAMGITGQRGFDPRLNADRIAVRRLTPVQLAPSAARSQPQVQSSRATP